MHRYIFCSPIQLIWNTQWIGPPRVGCCSCIWCVEGRDLELAGFRSNQGSIHREHRGTTWRMGSQVKVVGITPIWDSKWSERPFWGLRYSNHGYNHVSFILDDPHMILPGFDRDHLGIIEVPPGREVLRVNEGMGKLPHIEHLGMGSS